MDVAAEQALSRLTRAEELARYAAHPDELRWVDQDPRADESTVRKALFGSCHVAAACARGWLRRPRAGSLCQRQLGFRLVAWLDTSGSALGSVDGCLAEGATTCRTSDRRPGPGAPPPRPSRRRSQRSSKRLTMLRLGAGGVVSFLPRPRRAVRRSVARPTPGSVTSVASRP